MIASFGVLVDSTAAIIGAMIVAPLMEPILGVSAALVAARPRRLASHAALLIAGVLVVYLISTLIGATSLDLSDDLTNAAVTSRTSPTLADLGVAVAAGAVGGLSITRTDIAGSLPGVAIAVSLVPPLCVSGVTLAGGDSTAALGALLLFAVNLVAIIAAGGAVLIVAGFGSAREVEGRRLLLTGMGVTTALALLTVPLATTGRDIVAERDLESAALTEFNAWVEPVAPAHLMDLTVDGAEVHLLMASHDTPPSSARLQSAIEEAVGYPVQLELGWVRSQAR
ncbi:DUF389 domain-containing protein [Janibacter alittae]|uniref:DUF389 domain-containing protein n=1 Tax=Janibacter alittae TaxID=3115209 RepID=A0ABZ2MIJ0_9MICO